jgi:hypothetical protein
VTIIGGCPADPADIKCCTKASCANTSEGNCRWTSDCAGTSITNQCPGPSQMLCCSSSATGFGGYSAPTFPPAGTCKYDAVKGAKKVVAAFPGRVRQIYCTGDCGKGVDFMCSDGDGVGCYS